MGNTNVKPLPKPRNKKQLRWKAAERPSPPGKPSLNQENGFIPNVVQINWTKSEKEGGSTVTSYLVEHRRLGTTHWQKSSQFPVLTNELAVSGLEPGWRYQFRVRAENAVGLSDPSEISEPYTVTLQRSAIAAPKFTQELNDAVILENAQVEFEVHFLGQPMPNICWFKNGFEIFSGNRTRITTVSDKSVLTILHTTAADEGEIKCTATNKAGHASTKCKLTVEAPPSIKLPKSYQDQDGIIFEIGETIKLNVTVSGKPTPLIFWSHDGESIQNNDRYEIEYNDKIASVKIENALRSDRGEYQVKAVNKLGQDQASFLVTITDKPTPPGKARVLLTSGKSVTLSWSTPEDDGGCRVGNYIIEYYRLGWNVWLKAATTRQLSTMLGDLIEGSQYKFRVKAESPYGVSEPSEESEVVFIPDPKRGIREPSDVKRNETDSHIPLPNRRRANSTPRVSFVLNEDTPVRPERKKTGRTPEASPRMRRKQMSSLTKNMKALGSEPFLNRQFSMTSRISTSSGNSSPMSWENSPTSPMKKQVAFNYPGLLRDRMTPKLDQEEKNKSPSPEIIITDTDVDKSLEKSPSLIRKYFKKSPSVSPQRENSPPKSPNSIRKFPSISPHRPDKLNFNLEKTTPKSSEYFEKSSSSPDSSGRSPSRSPNHLERSPLESQIASKKQSSISPNRLEKSPSPTNKYNEGSPSRNDVNLKKSPPGSPSRSPRETRQTMLDYGKLGAQEISASEKDREKNDKSPSPQVMDLMRPTLTHQPFSGSSEFMLVLCPEGEQGTHFRKFDISFEDSSIPPPLSLSAPELGIEPPELPQLKRSASSTELLTYHLMERLHEAVMKQEGIDSKPSQGPLNIPTIQVNSEPTKESSHEKQTLNRRLSGILPNNQSSWSHRRHSLKNAKELNGNFGNKLHKFEDTPDMRREVSEYRKISESEDEKLDKEENTERVDQGQWMNEYEESLSSEEESEPSSEEERKIRKVVNLPDNTEEEEEMYNPRNRMMSAKKVDDNQPFEILTVRKNPPNSNIIPKPILKKTTPTGSEHKRLNIRTTQSSASRNIQKDYLTPKRTRSNSLVEAVEDEIDVSQIKTSPSPQRRRSFSLIPTNANFIKDAFKPNSQKEYTQQVLPKDGTAKNVSALANFTSIAGAGFIIPKNMQEKKEADVEQDNKETREEAKVVVDFYGDIVKNFGGKSKPTAEFSRTAISKYDTYEERKISDIKPNTDSLSSPAQSSKPGVSKIAAVETLNYFIEKPVNKSETSHIISNTAVTKAKTVSTKTPTTISSGGFEKNLPSKPEDVHSSEVTRGSEEQKAANIVPIPVNTVNQSSRMATPAREMDDLFRQMRDELSRPRSQEKSRLNYQQDRGPVSNRGIEYPYRESRSSSRPGSRQSSVGRRKKTPMSRDASTSPVRFLDDWDSQCSSRNSLERDYYNRESLTSSRASSLSRRSLSPPKPKLRAITTQTSFGIGVTPPDVEQQKLELAKKADKRMRNVFEYSTDLAMISAATSLYLFHHEYYAIPFLLILIYRQLGEKIQNIKEGVKNRIPLWIRKRFGRKS